MRLLRNGDREYRRSMLTARHLTVGTAGPSGIQDIAEAAEVGLRDRRPECASSHARLGRCKATVAARREACCSMTRALGT